MRFFLPLAVSTELALKLIELATHCHVLPIGGSDGAQIAVCLGAGVIADEACAVVFKSMRDLGSLLRRLVKSGDRNRPEYDGPERRSGIDRRRPACAGRRRGDGATGCGSGRAPALGQ